MNFRLLSDTPIAPAGRRPSGADIFAPPAEVCGTNFPLLLPYLWGSVLGRCFGRYCYCSSKLFLPIFILIFAPCFSTSAEFLQVAMPKVCTREPLPDCIGAGGLSLLKFPSNPIIKRNARICCIFQSYKKTPGGKK